MFRTIWDKINPPVPASKIIARSMHPHRVLAFARTLISDKRRWTTGVEARMASGSEVDRYDERAVCFCANGAISACSTDERVAREAALLLGISIRPDMVNGSNPNQKYFSAYTAITQVNDKKGHRAILKAFDKALAS